MGVWAEFSCQQVDRFGNDHRGGDQRPGRGFEELEAGVVAVVCAIGLHVVVVVDEAHREERIVTVYEPNPTRWSPDFRRRRS